MLLACAVSGQSAQQYFDNAATKYIAGDLAGAAADLQAVLRLVPGHVGAQELMKGIKREEEITALRSKKIFIPAASVATPATKEILAPIVADEAKPREYFITLFIVVNLIAFLAVFFMAFWLVRFFINFSPPRVKVSASKGGKVWHAVSAGQKAWYERMHWHKNPFTLDVHSTLFTGYKDEVKGILEKINARSGHVLIVGDLGVGKTTTLRWLCNNMPGELNPIYVPRPPQNFDQLIRFISDSIGFIPKHAYDYNIYNLNNFCRKFEKGLVLLIDEAHEFTVDMERPLRTLGDLGDVILVLGGLPETIEKLKKEILPLYERLVLTVHLQHLNFEDLSELIKVRIEEAGGTGLNPFTAAAMQRVFELSGGVPRKALKVCDRAVTQAINIGEDKIVPAMIESAQID